MIDQQQPTTIPDFSHYDQREEVLTRVIMSLPELLNRCEEIQAATIVADLLKANMRRGAVDAGIEDDLDTIVNRVKAEEEDETDIEGDY